MTRAQRSYHAFVRELKTSQGISHKEAVKSYGALRDRLGRAPAKLDISRHPRMTRDAVKTAQAAQAKEAAAAKRSAAAQRGAATKAANKAAAQAKAEKRSLAARKGAETRRLNAEAAGATTVRDGEQWNDYGYWEWEDAEYEDYHAGIEYETPKR